MVMGDFLKALPHSQRTLDLQKVVRKSLYSVFSFLISFFKKTLFIFSQESLLFYSHETSGEPGATKITPVSAALEEQFTQRSHQRRRFHKKTINLKK